jgi:hypothetical protein
LRETPASGGRHLKSFGPQGDYPLRPAILGQCGNLPDAARFSSSGVSTPCGRLLRKRLPCPITRRRVGLILQENVGKCIPNIEIDLDSAADTAEPPSHLLVKYCPYRSGSPFSHGR